MEPTHYFRLFRYRWKTLAICMVLGAVVGLGVTYMANRAEADAQEFWLANHKLIVSQEAVEAGRYPNLLQTALSVTGGEVPETVAEQYDTDDETNLTKRIRTVVDSEVGVLEISAVGTDADDAAALADAFAAELVRVLGGRELELFESEVAAAQFEVDTQAQRLDELRLDLATARTALLDLEEILAPVETEDGPVAPEPTAEQTVRLTELRDEIRSLELELASRTAFYDEALVQLDRRIRQGSPAAILETLDIIPAYKISESAYDTRVKQGRRGENNFNSRSVPGNGGGGLNLRDRVSNPVVGAGLGIIAGLLMGIGGILVHMRLDPRIRSKAQAEAAFGLPVLSEIPKFRGNEEAFELHALTRPRSMVTESYRVVRSALVFARAVTQNSIDILTGSNDGAADGGAAEPTIDLSDAVDSEMRVVMVTSPGPSEGKTTTTANMAVVLAEAGYNVLVVNCDYRLPKLHQYFRKSHVSRRTIKTGIENVTLIADVAEGGAENPTTVVEAQRNLIRKARDHYDVILLDTAPLLATNDALSLLPVVDMVVLVAREGRTDREGAAETVDVLQRRRANLAGVVLTGSSGYGRSRYYYKYRYGNYYDAVDEQDAQAQRTTADGILVASGTASANHATN